MWGGGIALCKREPCVSHPQGAYVHEWDPLCLCGASHPQGADAGTAGLLAYQAVWLFQSSLAVLAAPYHYVLYSPAMLVDPGTSLVAAHLAGHLPYDRHNAWYSAAIW